MAKQVSTVAFWYRSGLFRDEAEARGAFRLAHQQAMDGAGQSVAEWMGLSETEFAAWTRNDALPVAP